MPKRKREEGEEEGASAPRIATAQPSKILRKRAEEKIFHGRKLLQRALKVAKGFERQKLGRREKQATDKGDDAETQRIANEIKAIKDLDLSSCAEHHLAKTLLKIKPIAASPSLPSSLAAPSKHGTEDNAVANVHARLYNSKPVKAAMSGIVTSVQVALGLNTSQSTSHAGGKGRQLQERCESKDNEARVAQGGDITAAKQSLGPSRSRDAGLHPLEQDMSEDDSGIADDMRDSVLATHRQHSRRSASPSTASRSSSPEPISKTKRQAQSAPSTSKTSFLPSLTMGGYWSGSEGASDVEEDVDVAPRKNRRGQRARQQIWEKKFGKGAKHLANAKPSRDEGWDMQRGARAATQHAGSRYKPRWAQDRHAAGAQAGAGPVASGGNASPVMPRSRGATGASKPKPDQPMHPSWEAAKRAKEQSQTGTFAGKKMVFE